jgi:hypothetical protein
MLWRRTYTPMRAAVTTSRLCHKLVERASNTFAEELTLAAVAFESRAIGILDQITVAEDAIDILTCQDIRREEKNSVRSTSNRTNRRSQSSGNGSSNRPVDGVKIWPGSILDEACSRDYPCRRFLSHHHCQHVLDSYLVGNYRGSFAAVPTNTSVLTVLCQVHRVACPASSVFASVCTLLTHRWVVHLRVSALAQGVCHLVTALFLGSISIEICEVHLPKFKCLNMSGDDESDDDDDDDDCDIKGEMEEDEDYSVEQRGDASNEVASTRVSWFAFWSIPLVRFVTRAVMSLFAMVLLLLILYSPRYDDSSYGDGLLIIDHQAMCPGQIALEGLFWMYRHGASNPGLSYALC